MCLLDSSRGLAALLLRWNVLLILLLRTAPVDKRSFFTGAAQTSTEVKVTALNHNLSGSVNYFSNAVMHHICFGFPERASVFAVIWQHSV